MKLSQKVIIASSVFVGLVVFVQAQSMTVFQKNGTKSEFLISAVDSVVFKSNPISSINKVSSSSSVIQISSSSKVALSSVMGGNYVEDMSVAHSDEKTTDGNGRWIFDDDTGLSGTTKIVDESGKQSSYPACNAVGTDCTPFKTGYVYGKVTISGYIPGTTGWGQWAGGGLILDPKTNSYKEPGSSDKPTPIGLTSTSIIEIDMDATLTGGSANSGNTMIKFRLGEASYACANDGTCMGKRVTAKSGRAVYSFLASDFKKNGWIYTDAGMKSKGRNVDNYSDVYRLEVRHDAEPQSSSTDKCIPSTATFKIYKVTIK